MPDHYVIYPTGYPFMYYYQTSGPALNGPHWYSAAPQNRGSLLRELADLIQRRRHA